MGPHDSTGVRISLVGDFPWPLASERLATLLTQLAPIASNPVHAEISSAAGDGRWFYACAGTLALVSGGAFTVRFELPQWTEPTP